MRRDQKSKEGCNDLFPSRAAALLRLWLSFGSLAAGARASVVAAVHLRKESKVPRPEKKTTRGVAGVAM
eukprot:173641-Pyramimonas_sp.AAC.1